MKRHCKLHHGPGECIGASWALCFDKLGHAALISFCYSAVCQKMKGRDSFFQLVNQHQHISFLCLNINCGFFLHGRTSGQLPPLPPAPEPHAPEPPAEPVPGPKVEPTQVFFCISASWCVFWFISCTSLLS